MYTSKDEFMDSMCASAAAPLSEIRLLLTFRTVRIPLLPRASASSDTSLSPSLQLFRLRFVRRQERVARARNIGEHPGCETALHETSRRDIVELLSSTFPNACIPGLLTPLLAMDRLQTVELTCIQHSLSRHVHDKRRNQHVTATRFYLQHHVPSGDNAGKFSKGRS